jgi:dUTP pyrophosphatase
MKFLIKKFREFAPDPVTRDGDSGFDLFAAIQRPLIIPAQSYRTIPTGIGVEVKYFSLFGRSKRLELQVRPRSGHTMRGIVAQYGTIDESYRGEIKISIYNMNKRPIRIEPGEKIAQLVIVPIYKPKMQIVENLSETERGENGFGSTGDF